MQLINNFVVTIIVQICGLKFKKLTDHKKYNTIPDNICYGNNIFSNCERKSAFNKFFSSIATDLQDKYLPIVNSENRSSHERYLKNPQKIHFIFHLYLLMIF